MVLSLQQFFRTESEDKDEQKVSHERIKSLLVFYIIFFSLQWQCCRRRYLYTPTKVPPFWAFLASLLPKGFLMLLPSQPPEPLCFPWLLAEGQQTVRSLAVQQKQRGCSKRGSQKPKPTGCFSGPWVTLQWFQVLFFRDCSWGDPPTPACLGPLSW